jgi:inhibitor of KinA
MERLGNIMLHSQFARVCEKELALDFTIEPLGDQGAIFRFAGDEVGVLCRRILALEQSVMSARIGGVIETVPAYSSLAVYYDPNVVSYADVRRFLTKFATKAEKGSTFAPRLIELPVCYEVDFAPDMLELAAQRSLSVESAIACHLAPLYTVAMIGFTPGFPYLLGLDERLATPRRKDPRRRVPAGSVGIGGSQTGVYSMESPGGWNIVGRTPIRLFQTNRTPAGLLAAGDSVRFIRIDEMTYKDLEQTAGSDFHVF